jgi:hypothetical protein
MRGEGFWGEEGFCWGMETGKNLGKYWGFYRIASLPQLKKAPAPRGLNENDSHYHVGLRVGDGQECYKGLQFVAHKQRFLV